MSTESASDLSHHFLIAMPSLEDPNFGGSLVFIAEHNAEGALGLVINRPMEISLGTLFRRIDLSLAGSPLVDEPVMYGGPVQTDRGFVLHRPTGAWGATVAVKNEIGLTSSRDVLEAAANGKGPDQMLVMLGYSGWGPGQLEDEITRNAWLTVEADPAVIFETPVDERLHRAFALLGVNPAFLASAAGHA
ncbi:MAG: YqgE/AlgH family protein [Betaproteobacteria bacterium]|jgi:putative transcriptional regulator